jgi:2',3'-cyclic-nucleotide 2'-phosphodiesterase (5'-nucleotidase family)
MRKHRLLTLSLAFLVTIGLNLVLARDFVLDRLLSLSLTLLPLLGLSAGLTPDLVLINLADTRSAYDNYPRVLSVVERIVAEHEGTPTYILFNGNLFGRHNVVTTRSEGEIDWAFLSALQERAPVIFNIGPQDLDFMDPEDFVREAEARGVTVVSNLADSVSGESITPAVVTLEVAGRQVDIVGLAQPILEVYRQELQPSLEPPNPVPWLQDHGALLAAPKRWMVFLSRASVGRDIQIRNAAPRSSLVVGSDQQVAFYGRRATGEKRTIYLGIRAENVNVTRVTFARDSSFMKFEDYTIGADMPANHELQEVIDGVKESTLRPEDLIVVGVLERDYTVAEAALWAVESLRDATNADVAVLNNNFFGAGLSSGPLYAYRFSEFYPFDRDVVTATVDGATLQDIISIASLDASTPIRPLRSFFVYASDLKPRENELYILVTSTEVARFDEGLLGTAEIEFEGVPGITVKSLLRTALAEQAREDTTAVFVNTERALRSKIPPAPFARGIPIKVGDISFVILGYER